MAQDLKDIVKLLAARRKYASFFETFDKERKELGVGEELLKELNSSFSLQLSNLKTCSPDPPDLTCTNESGELIAIEITEVVDEDAVRENQNGNEVFRVWRPGELQQKINSSLSRKDKICLNGGPYKKLFVCLFTDEMMLTHDVVSKELAGISFGPFTQITDAFLLFSYQPTTQSYPVMRLGVVP